VTQHHVGATADPSLESHEGLTGDQLAALVRECIGLMRAGGIEKLMLKYDSLELRLRAHRSSNSASDSQSLGSTVSLPSIEFSESGETVGHIITAPMIGTFYRSSAPGEPAFVEIGDRVEEGQTIGIIEAMKIMNEIAADQAGIVEALLAENGQTVEYGSPLVRLVRAVI
jgi:acetyl-CoA carboxylase biotin carboxyl carrier protein